MVAVALRKVGVLEEMETMRAAPVLSRWVRVGGEKEGVSSVFGEVEGGGEASEPAVGLWLSCSWFLDDLGTVVVKRRMC